MGEIMKLKIFSYFQKSYTQKNISRNINYNPPLKNPLNLSNNMQKKKNVTAPEAMAKIIEHILKSLYEINKGYVQMSKELEKLSRRGK